MRLGRKNKKNKNFSLLRSLPDFRTGVRSEAGEAQRNRNQRTTRPLHKFLIILGLIIGVGVIANQVTSLYTSKVLVSVVTDDVGYVPLNKTSIEQSAQEYLDNSFIEKFIINRSQMIAHLKEKHKAIDEIEITDESETVQLEISARRRAVVWLQEGAYYEVDTSGTAFRRTNKEVASQSIVVRDTSGIPVEIDSVVATPSVLDALSGLTLANSQLTTPYDITEFIVPDAAREVHFKLKGKKYTVKTLTSQNPAAVFAGLNDATDFFKQSRQNPSVVVDLRVDGRAVYR